MTSILVIDDDPLIGRFLERGLRAAGLAPTVAPDAAQGRGLALSGAFDLVLLDLVLGDDDGFLVLRDLRNLQRTLPVLVITGFPARRDAVECLENGADDYLVKPFRFDELLARIRARLRHGEQTPDVLSVDDLTLNLLTRRVTIGGRRTDLTSREFSLLQSFLRHPDQVLSRAQLVSQVWGYTFDPASNLVNFYIGALRRKIGEDRIETVRGAGYRLLVQDPDGPVRPVASGPVRRRARHGSAGPACARAPEPPSGPDATRAAGPGDRPAPPPFGRQLDTSRSTTGRGSPVPLQ